MQASKQANKQANKQACKIVVPLVKKKLKVILIEKTLDLWS